jgi:hypothetical protein
MHGPEDADAALGQVLDQLLAPPLALVNVARFMHRRLLDACVARMPRGCALGVHHFLEGAVSLKSGKSIKPHDPDMCSLAPGELRARYAEALPHILLCDEETREWIGGASATEQQQQRQQQQQPPAAGRPMVTFVARKHPLLSIAFCTGGGVRARLQA